MELIAPVFVERFRRRFRWSVTGREQLPVFFTCRYVEGGDAFLDVEFERNAT